MRSKPAEYLIYALLGGISAVVFFLRVMPTTFQMVFIIQVPLVTGFCLAAFLLADRVFERRIIAILSAATAVFLLGIGVALIFLIFPPSSTSHPAYDMLRPPQLWSVVATRFVLMGLVSAILGALFAPGRMTLIYGLIGLAVGLAALTVDVILFTLVGFKDTAAIALALSALLPIASGFLAARAARKQNPVAKRRYYFRQGLLAALISGVVFSNLMTTSSIRLLCGGLDDLNCSFDQIFRGSGLVYFFLLLYLFPSLIAGVAGSGFGSRGSQRVSEESSTPGTSLDTLDT